jgi:uncharacterized protein (TIGR03790 family)
MMRIQLQRGLIFWVGSALLFLLPPAALASANALRTLVVVNTQSVDSVELGEHYAALHDVPAHHVCSVGFSTNLVSLASNEFHDLLLMPILDHLDAEGLDGQIDFLVLCQEFPTRVRNTEGVAASLFYGFQNAPFYNEGGIGCSLPSYVSNDYFRAERAFRSTDAWNATNGFVTFHLLASNVETAKLVAARGAAAQSTFPTSTINLYVSGDQPRIVRERLYPDAEFSFTSLPGLPATFVFPPFYAQLSGKTNVMGYHDGDPYPPPFVYQNNTFLPGAYADHLTSWGGMVTNLANETSQATVLDWMNLGATASYGTVAEPCAYPEKFPAPHLGFYYVPPPPTGGSRNSAGPTTSTPPPSTIPTPTDSRPGRNSWPTRTPPIPPACFCPWRPREPPPTCSSPFRRPPPDATTISTPPRPSSNRRGATPPTRRAPATHGRRKLLRPAPARSSIAGA